MSPRPRAGLSLLLGCMPDATHAQQHGNHGCHVCTLRVNAGSWHGQGACTHNGCSNTPHVCLHLGRRPPREHDPGADANLMPHELLVHEARTSSSPPAYMLFACSSAQAPSRILVIRVSSLCTALRCTAPSPLPHLPLMLSLMIAHVCPTCLSC